MWIQLKHFKTKIWNFRAQFLYNYFSKCAIHNRRIVIVLKASPDFCKNIVKFEQVCRKNTCFCGQITFGVLKTEYMKEEKS